MGSSSNKRKKRPASNDRSGGTGLKPPTTFGDLLPTLSPALSRALSRASISIPTPCQVAAIPSLLAGKDALVRSGTGSGKTLAYLLPVVNSLLSASSAAGAGSEDERCIRAIVLVPTRELTVQVSAVLSSLLRYRPDGTDPMLLCLPQRVSSSSSGNNGNGKNGGGGHHDEEELRAEAALLRDRPAIVVSTPGRLAVHVRRGNVGLLEEEKNGKKKGAVMKGVSTSDVKWCIVDEADLVLSFGYADDLSELHHRAIPQHCQSLLLSATLSPSLLSLGRVVLSDPVTIEVEDSSLSHASKAKEEKLVQYYLPVPLKDKKLVLYVFLRLGLLQGKGLFFVNSTQAAYRLKLFWEQFHIRSAVLNAELPLASRCHILEEFNAGYIQYLIATDESIDAGGGHEERNKNVEEAGNESEDNEGKEDGGTVQTKKIARKKKKRSSKSDGEYGVSRGLDFRHVSFVVNVDLPMDPTEYTHRIGRTARGGAGGVALSLVDKDSLTELALLERVRRQQPRLPPAGSSVPDDALGGGAAASSGAITGTVQNSEEEGVQQPTLLEFDLQELEGFRYRVEDVGRAVTAVAVKESRAEELRREILNSERLREHFEENPRDLQLLKHDGQVSHVSMVQAHLK
mmetsp:Transcript_36223/g.84707  ORF Transcript_36223/g.84707 Transcript_36223/m.84707 type:complete len:627 (+) Transcript_36223:27-1907(+)